MMSILLAKLRRRPAFIRRRCSFERELSASHAYESAVMDLAVPFTYSTPLPSCFLVLRMSSSTSTSSILPLTSRHTPPQWLVCAPALLFLLSLPPPLCLPLVSARLALLNACGCKVHPSKG
eukprot:TRINITY_DN20705_c0_g1_i1.p2 TRINITY_DN20705_c0_g1~~TRINITY_DN20705_c0_g1_i1.p2  ORF type:complete len:121 (-),score=20.44 TRINITY_DN20705_c0_g1_i1:59-421(-)